MIEDMKEMSKHILDMYGKYRRNAEKKQPFPKRIIFYRSVYQSQSFVCFNRARSDGVSEGQFKAVLEQGMFTCWRAGAGAHYVQRYRS